MFKDALERVDEDEPEAGDGQRAAAEEAVVPLPQLGPAAALKRGSEQEDMEGGKKGKVRVEPMVERASSSGSK
eukprot:14382672-Heterocapsa_arctica.AAC.1